MHSKTVRLVFVNFGCYFYQPQNRCFLDWTILSVVLEDIKLLHYVEFSTTLLGLQIVSHLMFEGVEWA